MLERYNIALVHASIQEQLYQKRLQELSHINHHIKRLETLQTPKGLQSVNAKSGSMPVTKKKGRSKKKQSTPDEKEVQHQDHEKASIFKRDNGEESLQMRHTVNVQSEAQRHESAFNADYSTHTSLPQNANSIADDIPRPISDGQIIDGAQRNMPRLCLEDKQCKNPYCVGAHRGPKTKDSSRITIDQECVRRDDKKCKHKHCARWHKSPMAPRD